MRQFNQDEINAVFQAEQQLRAKGLIVDEADGKEEAAHNAERIMAFFDLNVKTPVTVQNVLAACEQMRDQMKWKPQEQIEFENIYSTLTSQEKDAFDSWSRPQRLINNCANNLAVLKYLKLSQRYEVNARTLLQASAQRIAAQLEWEPAPEQSSGRPRHADDGTGFLHQDKNPRYRNGRINHAYVEPGSKEADKQQPTSDSWQRVTEILARSGTHSQQAQLQAIINQNLGKQWREIHSLVQKAKR